MKTKKHSKKVKPQVSETQVSATQEPKTQEKKQEQRDNECRRLIRDISILREDALRWQKEYLMKALESEPKPEPEAVTLNWFQKCINKLKKMGVLK